MSPDLPQLDRLGLLLCRLSLRVQPSATLSAIYKRLLNHSCEFKIPRVRGTGDDLTSFVFRLSQKIVGFWCCVLGLGFFGGRGNWSVVCF